MTVTFDFRPECRLRRVLGERRGDNKEKEVDKSKKNKLANYCEERKSEISYDGYYVKNFKFQNKD